MKCTVLETGVCVGRVCCLEPVVGARGGSGGRAARELSMLSDWWKKTKTEKNQETQKQNTDTTLSKYKLGATYTDTRAVGAIKDIQDTILMDN